MDRVSDDDLDSLIKKWADPVQALEEGLLELPALVELRERRERDKANLANINAELDRTICQICERRHDIGNPCYRIK